MGAIYMITNKVNSKAYIGKTINKPSKRIKDHLSGNGNRILRNAVNKYGVDAFDVEILHDGIIPELLDSYEIESIAKHNTLRPNGYNLTHGGEGGIPSEETIRKRSGENHPMFGKKHSKQARQRMSNAHLGKKLSKNHREKISLNHKGKTPSNLSLLHSKEVREKAISKIRGKSRPSEVREKISRSNRSPHCAALYEFFVSLSNDIPLVEKQVLAHKQFASIMNRDVITRWFRRWHIESGKPIEPKRISKEQRQKLSNAHKHPNRDDAHKLYVSLSKTMSLAEKRKILRNKFPNIKAPTIAKWVRNWSQKDSED